MSLSIRNRIIEKYDLFRHYDIDPNSKHANSRLYRAYNSIIFRINTIYVIKIEVSDISADTAALIANDIASLVDSIIFKIKRERAYKALLLLKENL